MTDQLPTAEASEYPIVGQIVDDVEILPDGSCAMPVERLKHWGAILLKKFPRAKHPKLYGMLGGICVEFAKRRTIASIQLFALATVGAPAPEAEQLREEAGDFMKSAEAQNALKKGLGGPGLAAGMAPKAGGGVGLRGKRGK